MPSFFFFTEPLTSELRVILAILVKLAEYTKMTPGLILSPGYSIAFLGVLQFPPTF